MLIKTASGAHLADLWKRVPVITEGRTEQSLQQTTYDVSTSNILQRSVITKIQRPSGIKL